MSASERLRERLLGATPSPSALMWSWIGPLALTFVGGLLRFWDLGRPHQLVFDETYYVKQGYSMMTYGYERRVRPGLDGSGVADKYFTADTPNVFGNQPDMVVHPPVGKWVIGLGESLFGYTNSFGWRFSAALLGTLSILLVARCAWYIFRSAAMATIVAFLMAFEGHQFVHSRTGLLDIFVSFFALLMFFLILLDREQSRRVLARKVAAIQESGKDVGKRMVMGPFLGFRPYLWLAGIAGGLCAGTKWSGAFFIAMFGLMVVFWGVGARRAAGVRNWLSGTAIVDGLYAFVAIVGTALVTYVGSWAGWFASQHAYNRNWSQEHPGQGEPWMGEDLNSLWMYHVEAMKFHVRLTSPHAWQSNPWSWMVQSRPTLFFAEYPNKGQEGCTAEQCGKWIHNLGTVSIWWLATAAILVLVFRWALQRDWRAGAILGGWAAGYLPWFNYQERTIFTFYAVAFGPWVVLMAAYAISMMLGSQRSSVERRAIGRLLAGLTLAVVMLNFIFYWPIYTAQVIPRAGDGELGGDLRAMIVYLIFILSPIVMLLAAYVLRTHADGLVGRVTTAGGAMALRRSQLIAFAAACAVLAVIWGWSAYQVILDAPLDARLWWRSWT